MEENRETNIQSPDTKGCSSKPFAHLPILENSQELNKEFFEKWVFPFYMTPLSEKEFPFEYAKVRNECDMQITRQLLGDFNWRSRLVGAYFAAIKEFIDLEESIGNLLLRSDLCYAGGGYCLALATFNTPASLKYLQDYLHYYLTQKELWYNQRAAMGAVAYLDRINGTDNLTDFIPQWEQFVSNKPNWDLQQSIQGFAAAIEAAERLRTMTAS